MKTQKYAVNQHLIATLLSWVRSGEIAIPEIQRPFVWDSSKVRDQIAAQQTQDRAMDVRVVKGVGARRIGCTHKDKLNNYLPR